MCDFTPFAASMAAASVAITIAIAAIIAAIALSGGFFTAPAAPGAFGTAAVSTLVAIGALAAASTFLKDYDNCADPVAVCDGLHTNLLNSIQAIIVVLSIQAVACTAAALIAWVPFLGIAPGSVILGALIIQLGLIPYIIQASVAYQNCVKSFQDGTILSPLIAGLSLGYLSVLIYATRRYYQSKRRDIQ